MNKVINIFTGKSEDAPLIEEDCASYYSLCYKRIFSNPDADTGSYIPQFYKLQWVLTLDDALELHHHEAGCLFRVETIREFFKDVFLSKETELVFDAINAPMVSMSGDDEIFITCENDEDFTIYFCKTSQVVQQRKKYGFQVSENFDNVVHSFVG